MIRTDLSSGAAANPKISLVSPMTSNDTRRRREPPTRKWTLSGTRYSVTSGRRPPASRTPRERGKLRSGEGRSAQAMGGRCRCELGQRRSLAAGGAGIPRGPFAAAKQRAPRSKCQFTVLRGILQRGLVSSTVSQSAVSCLKGVAVKGCLCTSANNLHQSRIRSSLIDRVDRVVRRGEARFCNDCEAVAKRW